ncbi:peptidoglycan-binding protein LysM [Polaribacter litorisediminis]|uniref:peptidoglycan-binding protein LysM n=1 Tax=Polaribacter litorisediminis TaxID=1908341 RepID=UPI001CBEE27D|nr:peptidoglycan-binding protein LysM [Polaribacter litorisediminis]UAM99739.1 peptidoglycan-binding protein LysM [Polaribacter litorisediminis]
MMKKFLFFISSILLLLNTTSVKTLSDTDKTIIFPDNIAYNIPYLQRDFMAFKEAIAFKESQGKYMAVNSLGYLGKYQFGKTTLERFRIYDTRSFLKNPELQEKAFIALCQVNKWILRRDIKRSIGKTINGIKITESGILAAAHLSGAGNVKKFLRSNGTKGFSDAYGTSIQVYLKKFAAYDVSNIIPNRKATV